MSRTNQAYLFTREYLLRDQKSIISKLLLNYPATSECTSYSDPNTNEEIPCSCEYCKAIMPLTLDSSTIILTAYLKKTNKSLTLGLSNILLKKFKSIRLGNIFQAVTIYNKAVLDYMILSKADLEIYYEDKQILAQKRYNGATALHSTMINIYSSYMENISGPNRNNYKIRMIQESLQPVVESYENNIAIILDLIAINDTNINSLLKLALNKFKPKKKGKGKQQKSWELTELVAKINDFTPSSIAKLNGIIIDLWPSYLGLDKYQDKLDVLQKALVPFLEEFKFIKYMHKNLDEATKQEFDKFIRGQTSIISTTKTSQTEHKKIIQLFNEWCESGILRIYEEFCPDDSSQHTYIYTAYMRHLINISRLNPKQVLIQDDLDQRFYALDKLVLLADKSEYEPYVDLYLRSYITDARLLEKLYLYKHHLNYDICLYWSDLNYFRSALKDYCQAIKSQSKNLYSIRMALFRLLNTYKYIFLYYKRKDSNKEVPQPKECSVDQFLNILARSIEIVYNYNKNIKQDNLLTRKMLQMLFFEQSPSKDKFWQTTFTSSNKLDRRTLDSFLATATKSILATTNTSECIHKGIEQGIYMHPIKYDASHVQDAHRISAEFICLSQDHIDIDAHSRDALSSGGSHYGSCSLYVTKPIVEWLVAIVRMSIKDYKTYIESLTEKVRACVSLIRDEAYTGDALKPNFYIKVITGHGTTQEKTKAAIDKIKPTLTTSKEGAGVKITF